MLAIGDVTTWLCDSLATRMSVSGAMVGDGIAPKEAGWPGGTPNATAKFVPYIVVSAATPTSISMADTPLCTTVGVLFWAMYRIVAFENSRKKSDELASRARTALKTFGMGHVEVGDLQIASHQVFIDSISGATRDDSVNPKMWAAPTNFRIGVARRQAAQVTSP